MKAPRSAAARHAFSPHVSEVELEIEAPTLGEMFAEAGRALCGLLAGDAPLGALDAAETVVLKARDAELLLVDWLNELVFLSETQKKVYPEIAVEMADDRTLRATLRGATPERLRTAVKAATLHRLQVRQTPEGVHARVVLDV